MCWVMPPASPATTSAPRIASSRLVLPWSTWPMMVTTGGRGPSATAAPTPLSRLVAAALAVAGAGVGAEGGRGGAGLVALRDLRVLNGAVPLGGGDHAVAELLGEELRRILV